MSNGLHIRVFQDLELTERLIPGVLFAVLAGAAGQVYLRSWWWFGISPFIAAAFFFIWKSKRAELVVSQFEFFAKGDLGRRTRTRVVMAADVRGLEFQVGSALSSSNEELYVRTDGSSFLILPYLDWTQAQEVIEAIKKKLPGLSGTWY